MKWINTRGRKLSGENVTERVCSFIIRVLLKFTMRSCKGFRCSSDSEDAWICSSGGSGGGIRLCLVACCCSEASWLTPQASIFSHSLSRLHRLKHLWTLRVWYLRWVTVWMSENSRTSLRTTTTTPPWSVGSTWDASAESTRLTPTSSRFHLDSVWFFHIKHLWREFYVSLLSDEHQWRLLQGRRVLSAAIFCVWGIQVILSTSTSLLIVLNEIWILLCLHLSLKSLGVRSLGVYLCFYSKVRTGNDDSNQAEVWWGLKPF